MVNLSDFKLEQIRSTFEIDINGETQEVVVFNLLDENRRNVKDKIVELSDKGLDGDDLVEELYTDVFMECTNIILDEQIVGVLNNPTSDMLKVMQEIFDIVYELQTETMIEKYQLICSLKSQEYARLMLLKTEETMLITEKCKEVENNIKELKK